ncbi:uncharacterized protein L201_005236 [Kwoniella dendrophila CBS 6074]|uniref:Major facilitator superfamily (MFS) profile domain-containing protein n=1 Tax=Kwoniella dendrophila CBS 6074 TaxID=1295534 RepID=A0AAX4JZQ3_9TREE
MSSKNQIHRSGSSSPSTKSDSETKSKTDLDDDDIALPEEYHLGGDKKLKEHKIEAAPLAAGISSADVDKAESALGSAVLRALGLRPPLPKDAPDAIATRPSIWDGDDVEELKHKYIREDWENYEAFDPNFRWTVREEKKVRRQIDWKIMLWACIMFSALNMDRSNISNANSDGLLKELHFTQADYNLGVTLSKLGFLCAELPSQLISKRVGPDRWIPIQVCIFSIISASQFWLNGRASFLATRVLIAVFQGGFIPDLILYLSYWYDGRHLPIRLAWFWMSSNVCGIITDFLAVGFLKLRGLHGYSGWRWLFLFEGIITLAIGLASFFLMPTSPAKTKSKWLPKGYFTDREAKIIVNNVIRDDPNKGGMHNRQALTLKMIWQGITDYDMYPLYALGLLFGIPKYPVTQYLTLSFKELVLGIFTQFGITALSELVNTRSFVASAEDLWLLPCFIPLVALKDPINPWSYFAIETVLLSYPYTHAIQVAWTSRNAGTVQNRSVSASLYNMFVQASAMIGSNVYQASDKPRYKKANKGLIALLCFNVVFLYPGTWAYYKWRNRTKERVWGQMSEEERSHYLKTTTDIGNKRLDFRFAA